MCFHFRYEKTKRIIFYTSEELTKHYDFEPENNFPGLLCAYSLDQFIFSDYNENPLRANWVDCRAKPPKIVKTASLGESWVHDICMVHATEKNLVIGSFGKTPERLKAVDIDSRRVEWTYQNNSPGMEKRFIPYGVATDQHGHLFVCDRGNACIQIFSVENGTYLGPLIKRGEQGLGTPKWIRWSKDTKSLIVSHMKDHGKVNLSVLQLY